jgi:hypothetical protein
MYKATCLCAASVAGLIPVPSSGLALWTALYLDTESLNIFERCEDLAGLPATTGLVAGSRTGTKQANWPREISLPQREEVFSLRDRFLFLFLLFLY